MNKLSKQPRFLQASAKSKAIAKANTRFCMKKSHKAEVLLKRTMSSDDQVDEYRKYLESLKQPQDVLPSLPVPEKVIQIIDH